VKWDGYRAQALESVIIRHAHAVSLSAHAID
jgi:hypothetical protein